MGAFTGVLLNFQMAVAQSTTFTAIFLILSFLGCARLTIFFWNYFRVLADLFLIPGTNLSKYGARKGAWALVTGSSDGIGKEFALQLARKGFNIILVSRTESKLQQAAEAITAKYANVQVKYLVMDFSQNRPQDYEKIATLVSENEVTVLVNNVGQSHSIPVPFLETQSQEMDNIVAINDLATLKVTQIVAKPMAQRKRGLILTMGSFGGLFPTPFLATYSGSKAFLQQWSSALAAELKPLHVDVEFVLSYLVTSSMSKIRRPSAMVPTPRAFVATTLSGLGKHGGSQGRYATLTPFWSHALLQFFVENTVGVYSGVASVINYKFHLDIRRRALRKAERQAKKSS